MRFLPAWLVLILALPLLVVGVAGSAGLPTQGRPFYAGTLACGATALIVSGGWRLRTSRYDPLQEKAIDRFLNSNVLALGLAIDAFVFLLLAQTRQSGLLLSGIAVFWAAIWVPRFARRVRLRTNVVINRDPAAVFGFVSDFRNSTQWLAHFESVEKVTPGNIGPGTQFRFRQATPHGMLEMVDEIVDYEWASRLTDRVAGGRRPNLEALVFEPVSGGARINHTFESELSYGSAVSGQVLLRWTTTRQMRRARLAAWGRLKQVLEAQTGA